MPACPGDSCASCCSARLVFTFNEAVASGGQIDSSRFDIYNLIANPTLTPIAGTVAAPGPYMWGWIESAGADFERVMFWLSGGSNYTGFFHQEMCIARNDIGGAPPPAGIHVWGPVPVPSRRARFSLGNGGSAAVTLTGEVWAGSAADAAAWAGRARGGYLGRTPAVHYARRLTNILAATQLRTPIYCIDPFHRLDQDLLTMAGLAAGVKVFSVDGNRMDYVFDFTGGTAGSTIAFRTLYGMVPADPLPFIGSTAALAIGGVTRLDSDERTLAAANPFFPPRAKGPYVQFEMANASAFNTGNFSNVMIRLGRE